MQFLWTCQCSKISKISNQNLPSKRLLLSALHTQRCLIKLPEDYSLPQQQEVHLARNYLICLLSQCKCHRKFHFIDCWSLCSQWEDSIPYQCNFCSSIPRWKVFHLILNIQISYWKMGKFKTLYNFRMGEREWSWICKRRWNC
jgi:hypothetical protein